MQHLMEPRHGKQLQQVRQIYHWHEAQLQTQELLFELAQACPATWLVCVAL